MSKLIKYYIVKRISREALGIMCIFLIAIYFALYISLYVLKRELHYGYTAT